MLLPLHSSQWSAVPCSNSVASEFEEAFATIVAFRFAVALVDGQTYADRLVVTE